VKKLAAILFVAIALFNLYGYQLVINYIQQRQESTLEKKLDNNNYSDAELMVLKLPVKLPYYANSVTYERVNGTVEINGIEYNYVKRRIYNDTIELACIPNFSSKKFQSVKDDFVKLNTEAQNTHQDKKPTNIKVASFEYCNKLITFSLPTLVAKTGKHFTNNSFQLPSSFKLVQEQPPDNTQA
jgi:hypothetical protein